MILLFIYFSDGANFYIPSPSPSNNVDVLIMFQFFWPSPFIWLTYYFYSTIYYVQNDYCYTLVFLRIALFYGERRI